MLQVLHDFLNLRLTRSKKVLHTYNSITAIDRHALARLSDKIPSILLVIYEQLISLDDILISRYLIVWVA